MIIIEKDEKNREFLLVGGPLYMLGCRLGLVREKTNTFRLGVALGLILWGVLFLLTLLTGNLQRFFSLEAIGGHIRLLVSIPLFFLCETIVAPRISEFINNIINSGLVRESSLPLVEADISRIKRMKDSWLAEIILLLVAFALPLVERLLGMPGRTANWDALLAGSGGKLGWVLIWYLFFCLPFFRFLLLRWLLYLGLWWYFLWRLERQDLNLIPTHPDGMAGLGYLEVVQEHFSPLMMAISALCSANFAEEISAKTMAFETVYPFIPAVIIVLGVIFAGPMLIFSSKLIVCRRKGLREYMVMSSRYVNDFDRKWIKGENATGEPLLGTADIQSLADLNNSMSIVKDMKVIPVSQRLIITLALSILVPLIPLLLFKYPFSELALKLFQILTGM